MCAHLSIVSNPDDEYVKASGVNILRSENLSNCSASLEFIRERARILISKFRPKKDSVYFSWLILRRTSNPMSAYHACQEFWKSIQKVLP